jgi:branched-chain amino acid transport system permease protein
MQILINGLISGAAIALLAIAFQVVYLPARVFFLGLAGIYTLAPFVVHTMLLHSGGWPVAILVALGVCVGVSLLSDWANHARLSRRNASEGAHLVASLGIYILIVQLIALIWGNETRTLRTGLHVTTQLGDIVVTRAQLITLSVAIVLINAFALFLGRSDLGLRLRAMADNPVQFALLGYSVDSHRLLAFGISGLLAAISSLLISYDIGFDPHVGLDALLLAIVAVIIGGRDSIWGPVLAGALLGIVRAEVVWLFTARWQNAATFLLLIIFLFVRPQGIMGRKLRLEEQT